MIKLSKDEFYSFQKIIENECGIHLTDHREDKLTGALQSRMQECGISSLQAYQSYLEDAQGKNEFAKLIERLTIGETFFFRNAGQLEILKKYIVPELSKLAVSANRAFNVWSAGCSTGEEPYSLAMLMLEILPKENHSSFSIVGTDVNRDSLSFAERACYGLWSLRQTPKHFIEKYFLKQEQNKFVLIQEVRQRVFFRHHNLLKDAFFLDPMKRADLIVCRNVMIYFDVDVNRRLVEKFAEHLNEGGLLLIGEAEMVWPMPTCLEPIEFPEAIVFRKNSTMTTNVHLPFVSIPKPRIIVQPVPQENRPIKKTETELPCSTSEIQEIYRQGILAMNDKDYGKALSCFEKTLMLNLSFFPGYLAKASLLANRGDYEKAVETLKKAVALDNLCAEAYYLLGVLEQKQGRWNEAIEYFRKALYVEPSLALAYFCLGKIYQFQKYSANAKREFSNALTLLEKKADDELVMFSEEMNCGYLRVACLQCLNSIESKI